MRAAFLIVALSACGSPAPFGFMDAGPINADAVVIEPCSTTLPTGCPDPAPSFANIQPIVHARCVSCHDGVDGGQWALDNYSHISDWRNEIRAHVAACTMPPAEAGVPMTNEERQAILAWIRCGLPM